MSFSKNVDLEIVSIGVIEKSVLLFLQREIPFHLPFLRCTISERLLEPPIGAYDRKRGQYDSSGILDMLARVQPRTKCDKLLAVTPEDLFVAGLNYVFGQAMDGYAVISLARLSPSFYGLQEDSEIYLKRVAKEVVHELGHTFGLMHCREPICVMYFSNSILDTDRKSTDLCRRCASLLGAR